MEFTYICFVTNTIMMVIRPTFHTPSGNGNEPLNDWEYVCENPVKCIIWVCNEIKLIVGRSCVQYAKGYCYRACDCKIDQK